MNKSLEIRSRILKPDTKPRYGWGLALVALSLSLFPFSNLLFGLTLGVGLVLIVRGWLDEERYRYSRCLEILASNTIAELVDWIEIARESGESPSPDELEERILTRYSQVIGLFRSDLRLYYKEANTVEEAVHYTDLLIGIRGIPSYLDRLRLMSRKWEYRQREEDRERVRKLAKRSRWLLPWKR